MAKSDRLNRLLSLLRQLPQPVTATQLAQEAEVSQRTVYRDIEALRASGLMIDGAPHFGYTLTEDPAMPPLMFNRLEVEAIMLAFGATESFLPMDPALAEALSAAKSKIIASMPERVQRQAQHAVGRAYRYRPIQQAPASLVILREAAWDENAVDITYQDRAGLKSSRCIWPLAIVATQTGYSCLAWCCLRQDFRHFRLDAITRASRTNNSFRPRRVALLREHLAQLKARARNGPALGRMEDEKATR